jgi:dTDP-4-dehydrorhamnose reductase
MLGATVSKYLNQQGLEILEGNRAGVAVLPDSRAVKVEASTPKNLASVIQSEGISHVVNCIGLIKQLISESDTQSVLQAIKVNSKFPRELEKLSLEHNFKIIQIATDCVYSGERGAYSEDDPHSPIDVYGMTKSLGEVLGPKVMTLRCSIVGPEIAGNNSLLSWFLSQSMNEKLNGFSNHIWNGLTSLHFSKIVAGIIKSDSFKSGRFHLVPANFESKGKLLELFAQYFLRPDLRISYIHVPKSVNRTLMTRMPLNNIELWNVAGYNEPPSIEQMIAELAAWMAGGSKGDSR